MRNFNIVKSDKEGNRKNPSSGRRGSSFSKERGNSRGRRTVRKF
jgi:hypothetical protein